MSEIQQPLKRVVRGYIGLPPLNPKTDRLLSTNQSTDEHFFSSPPSLPLYPPPILHGQHKQPPLILVPNKLPLELRKDPTTLIPQELTNFKPSFYPPCIQFTPSGLKCVRPRRPRGQRYEFSKAAQRAVATPAPEPEKDSQKEPTKDSQKEPTKDSQNKATDANDVVSEITHPVSRSLITFTTNNNKQLGGSCPTLPLKAPRMPENPPNITWTEELQLKDKNTDTVKAERENEKLPKKKEGDPLPKSTAPNKQMKGAPVTRTTKVGPVARSVSLASYRPPSLTLSGRKGYPAIGFRPVNMLPPRPTRQTHLINTRPHVVFMPEEKKKKKVQGQQLHNTRAPTLKRTNPPAGSSSSALNRNTQNARLPAQRQNQRKAVKAPPRPTPAQTKDKLKNRFIPHQITVGGQSVQRTSSNIARTNSNIASFIALRNIGSFKKGQTMLRNEKPPTISSIVSKQLQTQREISSRNASLQRSRSQSQKRTVSMYR